MVRLRNVTTGVSVSVDDGLVGALGSDWESADAAPASEGYSSLKVDELKAEIERRNEGRGDADLLAADGKKADLIAALEADDSK